jgi:hypothetical protein
LTVEAGLQEVIELLERCKSHLADSPAAQWQDAEEQIEHINDGVKRTSKAEARDLNIENRAFALAAKHASRTLTAMQRSPGLDRSSLK